MVYDYDKLLREKQNMEERRKSMVEIYDLAKKLGIRLWLYEGGLLGIYRDGDFIPWDWDLDFLAFTEELMPKLKKFKNKAEKLGFEVSLKNKKARASIRFVRNGERIAINGYYLNKTYKLRVRIPYRFPARMFGDSTITFEGKEYLCPSPIEEYLELAYGDWKTPIKSGNPDDYRRGRDKKSVKSEKRYQEKLAQGEYGAANLDKEQQGYENIKGDI